MYSEVAVFTRGKCFGFDAKTQRRKVSQGWRLAIIDADKLLDQALRQHGAKGETLGDRLRDREKLFSKYNDLWSAHKLRNRLVHEPQVSRTKAAAGRALQEFQRALKELGALA